MQPPDTFVYIFLFLIPLAFAQEWDASNFPNPTAGGFAECNMKSSASICDPDKILTEAQRYRLNHELNQLEARTRQENGRTFCEKKGITGAMAVAKHFRGGTEAAVKAVANEILAKWDLDRQCQKVVVFVMATEDRKFWVARDDAVPVYANEFTDLFNAQKGLFRQSDYQQGLHNILQGTWEKALSKAAKSSKPAYPDDGGRKRPPPVVPGGKSDGSGGFPKIPWTLIIIIVLVVIPLLLCCCCIYCCCCRNRNSGGQPPVAHTDPSYPQGGGGGGGARNAGIGGFLGGLGGSTAARGAMNFIGSKFGGGRGGAAPQPAGAGEYTPGQPIRSGNDPEASEEGRGLYPSVKVKDEGGGGGW